MLIETPKLLPEDLEIRCHACDEMRATHLCRYQIDALAVQVCLCNDCMKIAPQRLLENTVGIQGLSGAAMAHAAPGHGPAEEKFSVVN